MAAGAIHSARDRGPEGAHNGGTCALIMISKFYYCLVFCRGLLTRSVLQAQSASPIFTHVYGAVVSIINSKFPQIGELILKRLVLNFRKGYRRNDKVNSLRPPLPCFCGFLTI